MMVILMGFHLEFAQLFQENLSNLIQGVNFAELVINGIAVHVTSSSHMWLYSYHMLPHRYHPGPPEASRWALGVRAGVELSGWQQKAAISSISMANQRCRGAVSMKLCFQDLAKAFQAGGTSGELTSVGFLRFFDGVVRGNGSEILQCNQISVHGHQKYGLWLMNAIIIWVCIYIYDFIYVYIYRYRYRYIHSAHTQIYSMTYNQL